jgi:hypothetical protein
MHNRYWSALALVLVALPAAAQQQTGTLAGKVNAKDGKGIAGVRIDITANVLPQPKRVLTSDTGEYRLPFLPPGEYVLTYTHPNKTSQKRSVTVVLGQTSTVNVSMADAAVAGAQIEVVAAGALVDATSAELKSSFSAEVFNALPVGQDYRDMTKLIPGVMYSQDTTRGPSAGGSGQDNVHQFDGVNVNLPMYGTLPAAPSGHDIDQITISKGGADATGFNRSAGYTINSVSKSGTNIYTGELSFQILPDNMVATRRGATNLIYEQEKTYAIFNIGGPILQDKLFFFGSLYRPTVSQKNSTNLYGSLPNYSATRTEYFGKLTYAPTQNLLIHGSYRDSDDISEHGGYGSASAASTGVGAETKMKISTLEATWNVTPNSFINFKTTNLTFKSIDHPDYLSSAVPSFGGSIDVNAFDTQGQFSVPKFFVVTQTHPVLTAAEIAYNTFAQPFITKYGYTGDSTGATGGSGTVGGYNSINNQNFFRRNYELAYDAVWGNTVTHTFHAGVQWFKEMEDLYRMSNGWGIISLAAPSGTVYPPLSPIAHLPYSFVAAVNQQAISRVPPIHSEYVALNYELNDKIKWQNFTFNVGMIFSNDKLYGQGLSPDSTTASGYVQARGNKYLEKELKISDTLQPRLGVTWNYQKEDTVYANYARFVPSVSSLPRASSWDRNLVATVNTYFNNTGQQVDHQTDASSTGKLYAPGMKPRHTDEFLVGTTRDLGGGWSGRLYGRYRHSVNFWEDTDNGARVMFNNPYGPQTYYIPNLYQMINQLTGTTYANDLAAKNVFVVAQLDNSFTKYYEVCAEAEWKGTNAYLNMSYSWSHYYGNFDQDNSTSSSANDANVFIGSSNIGDDFGRQLWNNKYGNLSGDRRHKLKVFGTYRLPWQATVGAYFIYQSGQPWQLSDYSYYTTDRTTQGSSSTSDTNRYSEPAGSHTSPAHNQFDVNYTQIFWRTKKYRLEGMFDIYNLFNKQTGYNYQPSVHSTLVGLPMSYYAPRRSQLGVRFTF